MTEPRPTTVVLTATFTLEPLGGLLECWRRLVGASWEIRLAGYNQVLQELLDPSSATRCNDGLNVLVLRPADWTRAEGVAAEGEVGAAERLVPPSAQAAAEIGEALAAAVVHSTARWLVVVTPQSRQPDGGERAVLAFFQALAAAHPSVRVAAGWEIADSYRVAEVYDPEGDRIGHLPHPEVFQAALAAVVARHARARTARPPKVVAVDADHTLWRGVVGEVGVAGLVVDAGCRALQAALRDLRNRGLLLAVVSKNDRADVEAALRDHPDMLLRPDDFAALSVNWQPKSQNLRELAAALELGLDSFVFLDDNPVEVAEVRAHAPAVLALQVPVGELEGGTGAMGHFLDHVWAFDAAVASTAEDAARTGLYRAQAERTGALRQAPSFASFLESLQLVLEIAPATRADVPRLAQLTQRTNQFNAVVLRRTDVEMARDLETGLTALTVSARDRFGDYGLVGLAAFRAHGHALEVEHFLLSCRALGKRIEHRMIEALQAEAMRRSAAEIVLPLTRTERNEPVAAFLHAHFADQYQDGRYRVPAGMRVHPAGTPGLAAAGPAPAAGPDAAARAPVQPADLWQRVASELATASGMVAALAAARRRARPADMATPYREPASALERQVAGHFSDILALSPVGADDMFFELGGQSVLAAQVLARLSRECGHRLPLRALFDHPTPAALAAHLMALGPATAVAIKPQPRDQAAHPLSAAQRRMWFLDRYAPGHAAYHILTAHRLTGPLDRDRLRTALAALTRRHESLRALFPDLDGHPTQVFTGPGVELVIHDEPARTGPPAVAEPGTPVVVRAPEAALNLATGPLARLELTPLPEGQTLAVLTVHHIIADGWSLGVFFRDLSALAGGRPLPPLPLQPLDLAAHQDALAAAGAFEADFAHWRTALCQAPEALNLPSDFPRPAERTFDGDMAAASLPAAAGAALETLARAHGATLFAVLMAGLHALLHRWSGQDDILIGTPVSGRTEAAAEDVIGCLINTVVIRSRPVGTQTFAELLTAIRDAALAAFSHQDVPFERLVEALEVRRSLAHPPFFQVMLVLQNTPPADFTLPGVTSELRPVHNGTAKFDLVLEATPRPDGSHLLTLEYNTALFRRETASQLLSSFVTLLAQAAAAPATPLARLDLLTPERRHHLLHGHAPHRDFTPPAPTIHGWFERTAARFPDRTAVTCEGAALSYAELNRRANRLAHCLRAAGVTPGTPVAVCLERSTELVAALLGILKSGGAYLPIDLSYPAERLAFMLEDACAPVFLTERPLAEKLPPHRALVLCLDDPAADLESWPVDNPAPAATADDLIYIIYTSGSTGKPKGCCLTHRNVTRLFSATEEWFHFDERDVWTLFHSYAFDFSVWELWGALLHGGRLVVVPHLVSRSPEDFHDLLVRERVTVLNQTPSAFRQLIAAEGVAALPSHGSGTAATPSPLALRLVIFGGEALEMQSLQPWFERHGDTRPQLVNMYGITETTVHVTYRPLSARDVTGGSVIGVPIPDLRLYILDAHLQPCPVGVPGELFVGGAGVARGYLNRDELTAQRFLASPFVEGDRLYRTGDLARFLPGRDVEYLGRIDRQVKIRGFRIELGEIESALLTHSAIRDAAVLAREGPGGRQLVAYLVPEGGPPAAVATDDLRAHLRQTLPDYMVPAAWVFLPGFPLTPNGKLDTAALPEPEAGRPAAAGQAPPATATEEALAAIWQKVLRLERVGRHENFFAAGGDSILSIQIISQARQAGWPLAPRHIFEHQTIAELAACAEALMPAPKVAAAGPATGEVPLTPIQRWFAGQRLADPHWWNQAFLLRLRHPVGEPALRAALAVVLDRHDAFRLRLAPVAGAGAGLPVQFYAAAAGPPHLEILTTADGLRAAMERAHRALNVETGPVLGAVLAPDRLFLTAHHLAVDGVSWRVVLEDLEAALDGRAPAPAGDSFQAWSLALRDQAGQFEPDRGFWEKFTRAAAPALPPDAPEPGDHTEATVEVATTGLTAAETTELLTALPGRARARIDEILLTAVALAFRDVTGHATLRLHTEGHGREEAIAGVDVARTTGWFTALYPLELTLPPGGDAADALRAAKDQLRTIPHRGLGWGVLGLADQAAGAPDVVFNYLGQFDSLVAGSTFFELSDEVTPPWHGPSNRRAHAVEIDALVRDGRLIAEFRLSRALHREETRRALVGAFAARLRDLLRVPSALAPSDFPLVRLTPGQLADLGGVEDVWPLSPMQQLLAGAAAVKGGTASDQWHCRLRGPLDHQTFRQAWGRVLARHSLLRARLCPLSAEATVAVIPAADAPALADWRIEDWRDLTPAEQADGLRSLLHEDQRRTADPTRAPLLRFTLVRLAEAAHFFLWSVPDWMLDGWSWPVVFRDLGEAYAGAATRPRARSYREYLAWLGRHDPAADEAFWRGTLAGFRAPTPLPLDKPAAAAGARAECAHVLPAAEWAAISARARAAGLTPTALLMAAWATLLAQASGREDIVFGAAFSGRPADLPGVEGIVGPCTTNLPIRVQVAAGAPAAILAAAVRDRLFAASGHQLVSPLQVEDWSEVPWRDRVFDSLVVFQNYEVDASARTLGGLVALDDFTGPVHGSYALALVATPREDGLHLLLSHQSGRCSAVRAREIVSRLAAMVTAEPGHRPAAWPAAAGAAAPPADPLRAPVPPRTSLEGRIHAVWVRAFGPGVGVEDNFFEAGGHSLLAFRVLAALRRDAGLTFSPADLFQYPTIAALARKAEAGAPASARPVSTAGPGASPLDAVKARAARARLALGQR